MTGEEGTILIPTSPKRDPATNATAGAGMRVNDAFGLMLRGGAQRTSAGTVVPFVSLDLGAIGKDN